MSRALSVLARRAVFAPETEELFLLLLTISNVALPVSLRFVNDVQPVMSRGYEYLGWPFNLTLPEERDDAPSRMRITIDAVESRVVVAIRALLTPPTIDLTVVLRSTPDVVEATVTGFQLRQVSYDAFTVEADLEPEPVLMEGFPAHAFTPSLFPALY